MKQTACKIKQIRNTTLNYAVESEQQ